MSNSLLLYDRLCIQKKAAADTFLRQKDWRTDHLSPISDWIDSELLTESLYNLCFLSPVALSFRCLNLALQYPTPLLETKLCLPRPTRPPTTNSYAEVLNLSHLHVTTFGERVFKEVKMSSSGWALMQRDGCPYKKRLGHRHTHTQIRLCGDTGRPPSISQGNRHYKKLTLLTLWSRTSSFQNFEKINFSRLPSLW